LGLEEQHLGHDDVRHVIVDGRPEKDDAVFEQAAVEVVSPLAAVRLLNYGGVRNHCHLTLPVGCPELYWKLALESRKASALSWRSRPFRLSSESCRRKAARILSAGCFSSAESFSKCCARSSSVASIFSFSAMASSSR